MSARVADVMIANAVAVRVSAPFKQIAARLREQQVTAFPVIDDDDKVIGVVSEADLLPKEALEAGYEGHRGALSRRRHRAERQKAGGVTAADVMSSPAVTVGPYDLVSHAAHLMYDHKVTSLPVVDRERLVGVIRRADVLGVFGRPDADIQHDITERLILREFLADPARFTVTVQDGVVTLQGRPENADDGHDLVNAVRHTEGVVAVRDELTYPAAVRHRSGPAPILNGRNISHHP
jgi:CBS-domain-containing membrane protein